MLWCECGGNSSGTLIDDKLSHLHEGVWMQGVVYVTVVVVLYVIGFTIILVQGERNFSSSMSSSGGFLGLHLGCPDYYSKRKKHHRHRDKREGRPCNRSGSSTRERIKRTREIELRKLHEETQEKTKEKLSPLMELKGELEAKEEPLFVTKGNEPLIKVTSESTFKESSGKRCSTSNLISFM